MAVIEKNQTGGEKHTDPESKEVRNDRGPLLRLFRRAFNDASLEKLYLSYSVEQKREGLHCFLLASILYDIYYLAIPCDSENFNWPLVGFLVCNFLLLLWCLFGIRKCSPIWPAIPHVSWLVSIAQLLIGLVLKSSDVTGHDNLGWTVLMDYLLYVLLPLRLRYCILLSLVTCASYLTAITQLVKNDAHIIDQVSITIFMETWHE
ncbi:hypothetical protein RUM44_006997 [Polyplax serrata]|uniref:Uncharacterized protein n=1 Tax=Polyplax serrata TaxID=468196 RepID=A0ABR1B077_POLSC